MDSFTIERIRNGSAFGIFGRYAKLDSFREFEFVSFSNPSVEIKLLGTGANNGKEFSAKARGNRFEVEITASTKEVPVLSEIPEFLRYFEKYNRGSGEEAENFLVLQERQATVSEGHLRNKTFYLREGKETPAGQEVPPPFLFLAPDVEERKIIFKRAIRNEAAGKGLNPDATGFILCFGEQIGDSWEELILSSSVKKDNNGNPVADTIGFKVPVQSFTLVIPDEEVLIGQLGRILSGYRAIWQEENAVVEAITKLRDDIPGWVSQAGLEAQWEATLAERQSGLEAKFHTYAGNLNIDTLSMFDEMRASLFAKYGGHPQEEDLLAFLKEHFLDQLGPSRLVELEKALQEI